MNTLKILLLIGPRYAKDIMQRCGFSFLTADEGKLKMKNNGIQCFVVDRRENSGIVTIDDILKHKEGGSLKDILKRLSDHR